MFIDHGQSLMPPVPDRKIFEAAASWYVQFQSQPPTAAEQHAWQLWLHSHPAHLAAWNQMEQLQRSLGAMPREFTHRALSGTQQRRQVLKMLLILASTGYVGWNVQQHTSLKTVWADYRTPVGQRRRIELADGSVIQLNTQSAIDVVFDERQRLIRLREGEILLRTGKRGDRRPFFVETQQGRIQALGTVFSVRQLPNTTRVGVLEDQVSIRTLEHADRELLLSAGESVDFDPYSVGSNHVYRPTEAAWVDGQIVVLDARLGDVIDEISRYRKGVMHCDDAAARLRVSGTFRLDSTEAVLDNLQASLPIQVKYFTRYWVSIKSVG